MKEPNHKVKRHVVPFSDSEKPYWYENPVHGWLGSGVKDCNGKEIFEGDLVVIDDTEPPCTVFFLDGALCLETPVTHVSLFELVVLGIKFEVVGHIAEEVTANADSSK